MWDGALHSLICNAGIMVTHETRTAAGRDALHPGGIKTNLQRNMDQAEIRSRGWVKEMAASPKGSSRRTRAPRPP